MKISDVKIKRATIFLIWTLFLVYAVVQIYSGFNASRRGDETYYLREVLSLKNNGIYSTFSNGTSYLYVFLTFIFDYIINNPLLAARVVSFLSLVLFIYVLFSFSKLFNFSNVNKSILYLTSLIFLLDSTRSPYLLGMSDGLMISLLAAAFYQHIIFIRVRNIKNLLLSAFFVGLAFWVRSFSIIYLLFTVCFFGFELIIEKQIFHFSKYKNIMLFYGTVLFLLLIPQIPSIIDKHELSFENKNYMGDWFKRDYVTDKLRVFNNSIFAYKRVSWDDLVIYLEKNEVPKDRIDLIKKDPKYFLDNGVSNLFIRVPFLFISRSGLLFIMLFFGIFSLKSSYIKKGKEYLSVLLLMIVFSVFLSFFIIHNIEIRWMMLPIVISCIGGLLVLERIVKKPNTQKIFIYGQILFLMSTMIVKIL